MNNLYFNNVPSIGLLYVEKILFSFEDIAMVFVCHDEDKNRYLCVCDEVFDKESWIIVKVSNDELLGILNDERTVLSLYKSKKIVIADRAFGEDIKYCVMNECEIDSDEFPVCNQYLEMKKYLSEYIDELLSC